MEVVLRRETSTCGEWIVELRKSGARITINRQNKSCRQAALGRARELAVFLGVPLIVEGQESFMRTLWGEIPEPV